MNHRHVVRVRRPAVAFCLGLALALPTAASAQFTDAPAPVAYALRGVTVVAADGTTLTDRTLIVRAGRIETLAADAAVPADARMLDGDSLYVYPGLIDAAGTFEFEFPRDTTDRSSIDSWDPPRTFQGYTPSRRVIEHLTGTGEDGEDLREQGIVAVAVHPDLTSSLMPGRGVLVLLRPNADVPQQLVIQPELAPLMTFRGSRGAYPSTRMGVLAWYRQTFLDAQRLSQIAAASSGNSAGPALGFDPDMAVVQDVLSSNGRVFFAVNSSNDIRRVLSLAEEFGFSPVIVGGTEAWKVAAELESKNVPVLVSVDFPEPERWKPDAEVEEGAESEPLDPGAIREKNELEDAYANAARLARAGVTIALVSGGSDDLREGVLKAVEYGLPEADALRAITAAPAALLGAPQLVRISEGSAATFIVTDRPLLTEDANVLYTFVEGVMSKGSDPKKKPAAGDSAAAVDAAGTWTVEVLGPQAQTFSMTLTQEGSTITGTMEGPQGTVPVGGTVSGNTLSLTATITAGGSSIPIEMTGDIDGDEAAGQVETPMGSMEWKARRTGPGARP